MQRDAVAVDGDDVEPRARIGRVELKIIRRQTPQSRLLARMNAGDRASEGACRAQLHFDEHDLIVVLTDEVDLSSGKPHVGPNDPKTAGL